MVAVLPLLQPHTPAATVGLHLVGRAFDALERDGAVSAYLESLPDPAAARLYPQRIGDDVLNDAILSSAFAYFSLYERDARKAAEVYDGFTPAELHALGLRSVPSQTARIMASCAVRERFGDQSGFVAPLWKGDDGLQVNTPPHGLLFPVRRGGLVRAWLNYRQPKDSAPRWVSSSHLPHGCKVQPSIHVARSEYGERSGVCLLTSHALEAEEAAAGAFVAAVGLNGVTPAALVAQLFDEWPELRGITVSLVEVSPFLTRALQSSGLKVRFA